MARRFRLTRSQASGLARIIRETSWTSGIAGDHSVTVTHRDGTEVVVTVEAARAPEPKVIRGFRREET